MWLLWTIVRLSFKTLWANKLRSFLTILGIEIGVGAVIALMALGHGARESMTDMIRGFGSELVMLTPNYRSSSGVRLDYVERLTIDDCTALLAGVPELAVLSPQVSKQVQIKFSNQNIRATVTGVAGPYIEMMNYPLAEGRTFTPLEEERARKVAIAGEGVIEELFYGDAEAAIGQKVKIDGTSYTLVGALEAKGGPEGMNPDKNLYVPYTTAMKRLLGTNYIHSISMKVQSEELSEAALRGVTRVMRRRHRIRPDQEDDFQIYSFQDALNSVRNATRVFTILLAGIAGISLLVGGIGIMNIMLVTVTERTTEIGIRKALGAKRRDIMFQFLIESTIVAVCGGALGICLGAALAAGANIFAARANAANPDVDFVFRATISPMSVVIALSFCLFIGLFFGIYPARRASALDPIVALRHE